MIINCLLFIGVVLGSSTPLQLGPVPFFAGLVFAGVCLVALIARAGRFS